LWGFSALVSADLTAPSRLHGSLGKFADSIRGSEGGIGTKWKIRPQREISPLSFFFLGSNKHAVLATVHYGPIQKSTDPHLLFKLQTCHFGLSSAHGYLDPG